MAKATAEEAIQVAKVASARSKSPGPPSPPALPTEGVSITDAGGGRQIKTRHYEATVEGDGCLTSLRVGGVEYLWPGGDISRGAYFFRPTGGAAGGPPAGTQKLPLVEQPGPNIVTARNDLLSIRYEFAADSMACDVRLFAVPPRPDRPGAPGGSTADPGSRPSRTLLGHATNVTDLAFSPDGGRLRSLDAQGTFKEWDLTRTAVRPLPGADASSLFAFSRDGRRAYVAIAGEGKVAVVDLSEMRVADTIEVGQLSDGMAWAPAAAK